MDGPCLGIFFFFFGDNCTYDSVQFVVICPLDSPTVSCCVGNVSFSYRFCADNQLLHVIVL